MPILEDLVSQSSSSIWIHFCVSAQ